MELKIRDAVRGDYSSIMGAFRKAHGEICALDPDLYGADYPQTPRWKYHSGLLLRDVFGSKAVCLKVAEVDGRFAGVIFAERVSRNSWSAFQNHLRIDNVYVDQDLRRRGAARAMVEAVKVWARAAGYDYVDAKISLKNEASLGLFRSAGLLPRYFMAESRLG